MPKQQSSLDSFFGGGGAKAKKQKTLTSFFNKENSQNNDDDDHDDDGIAKASTKNSKRRAIIDDDDDDDDNDKEEGNVVQIGTADTAASPMKTDETSTETKPAVDDNSLDAAKPSSSTATPQPATSIQKASPTVTPPPPAVPANAPTDDDKEEDTQSPLLRKLKAQASKLVQQAKVPADDKLESLSSPALYKDLVQLFEQVEALSGRLEIQALLTIFVRRLLRDSPRDLYPVVYLASSSIAPAYECVELGIGDSILMKAIGDSYGTKASK